MSPTPSQIADAHKTLYEAGLATRTKVMSEPYVDAALANASEFSMALQNVATQSAWGSVWTRPGLSHRDRSLITVALLTALNRNVELKGHVTGALRNGVTVDELQELMIHLSVYAGMPAAMEGTRVVDSVVKDL